MKRKYPYLGISVKNNPDKTVIVYFSGRTHNDNAALGIVLVDNKYFKKGTVSDEWDDESCFEVCTIEQLNKHMEYSKKLDKLKLKSKIKFLKKKKKLLRKIFK